jgi:hypothetical protein
METLRRLDNTTLSNVVGAMPVSSSSIVTSHVQCDGGTLFC